MSAIKVSTNFNIDLEFEVPEFYRRLIALLIDFLILFFYIKISEEIVAAIERDSDWWSLDARYNIHWLKLVIQFMPLLLYHIVCEITMNGQSIGKKILGIRVVNENGGRASISQFLIRWLVRDIWFILILMVGLYREYEGKKFDSTFLIIVVLAYFVVDIILVVSSKKGQRIGDILARTILIRTDPKGNIEETVFREVADNYVPSFPQIMQLSDKDINAIKSILETARKKTDYHMAEAASSKIKAHLRIESSLSPFDFLDVLLKDYNYLSVN